MEKIGIYGGTFNPIHNGHLYMAEKMGEILQLDRIIFIPANVPPHKAYNSTISGEHRLKMCRLACQNKPLYEVSDIEIHRHGRSYTVDTLKEISSIYKESDLFFLMGSDSFLSINKWAGFEEIIHLATLCTVPRIKQEMSELLIVAKMLREKGADVRVCQFPVKDISSSQIRMRRRDDLSIEKMVPNNVDIYIRQNGFYKKEMMLICLENGYKMQVTV